MGQGVPDKERSEGVARITKAAAWVQEEWQVQLYLCPS